MWHKQGLIFHPSMGPSWMVSHAQVPVLYKPDATTWRIYFASRNANGKSQPGYIDVDADNPQTIRHISQSPLLPLGQPGMFDDSGIIPTWVEEVNGKVYLYYIGWTVRNTVPYHNSLGLAVSSDGGQTFTKISEGPILAANRIDPGFVGTIGILREPRADGSELWRGYYLSCARWVQHGDKLEPYYTLNYAESPNGIDWTPTGQTAIAHKSESEAGLVKATPFKTETGYAMYYAYRNGADFRTNATHSYRIGYATSPDALHWQRHDESAGITLSEFPDAFDNTMITYPEVFTHNGEKFMLYNGNGFGQTGFGLAKWVEGNEK